MRSLPPNSPTRCAQRQPCSCSASSHLITKGGGQLWAGRSLSATTSLQVLHYVDGGPFHCLQTWNKSIACPVIARALTLRGFVTHALIPEAVHHFPATGFFIPERDM